MGSIIGRILRNQPVPPPPPEQPALKPTLSAKPIRVSGGIQSAKLIHRVVPNYPSLAKTARIAGTVRLEAVISREGTIRELRAVSGHPLLVSAALVAVKQWRYRPTVLNGRPVEVVTQVEVRFTLR